VRVQIGETFGGFEAEHAVELRLHVDTKPEFSSEQVRGVVIDATVRVLGRLKTDMEAVPALYHAQPGQPGEPSEAPSRKIDITSSKLRLVSMRPR